MAITVHISYCVLKHLFSSVCFVYEGIWSGTVARGKVVVKQC